MGWRLLRHGANHDLWTNGEDIVTVPRHGEIVEMTARRVLNEARRYGS